MRRGATGVAAWAVLAGVVVVAAVVTTVALVAGGGDDDPSPSPDAQTQTPDDATPPARDGRTVDPAVAAEQAAAEHSLDSPSTLAAAIADAEAAIRDPQTPDVAIGPWARLQQAAYRALAARPEWDDEVAGHLEPDLQEVAAANVAANRDLWALTDPRSSLPNWTIVEPPSAETLLEHYRVAGAEFGVEWEFLAAIHLVETRMGRIRGDSTAGARGPMQFLPATWDAFGEGDIEDPRDAIRAAARYLNAHGAPDDMDDALFAYNHSDHYVRAVQAYTRVMRADERAYLGYHQWQVYYRLETGDVVLPVGWETGDEPERP